MNGPSAESDATSFANHVLGDWDQAMSAFFNTVDRKRRDRDLNGKQVRDALNLGYGHEVGDAWDEWYGEADSYEEDAHNSTRVTPPGLGDTP